MTSLIKAIIKEKRIPNLKGRIFRKLLIYNPISLKDKIKNNLRLKNA